MKRIFHAAVLGAALLGANGVTATPTMIVGTGNGGATTELYEVDYATGAVLSYIGSVGYALNDLAWDAATGTLYGSTSLNDPSDYHGLLTVDLANIIHRTDVAVMQRGRRSCFAVEPFDQLLVMVFVEVRNLERDPPVKLGVVCQVDRAHCPRTELAENSVASKEIRNLCRLRRGRRERIPEVSDPARLNRFRGCRVLMRSLSQFQ